MSWKQALSAARLRTKPAVSRRLALTVLAELSGPTTARLLWGCSLGLFLVILCRSDLRICFVVSVAPTKRIEKDVPSHHRRGIYSPNVFTKSLGSM